jgi:hypothetical protein
VTLRLSETTGDGYAESSRPIADLIQDAVKRRASDQKPAIVWIFDPEDEKSAKALEAKVFCDEKIGLALKQFICLKGDVESIPDERLMKKMRKKTPFFYFYDPAGKLFGELKGKRATSRSGFTALVQKLWDVSYEMKLRVYAKKMSDLLDRIDKLEGEKAKLDRKMASAASNPRKFKALQREEAKLKAKENKLLEDEQKILEACKLRDEFKKETAQK